MPMDADACPSVRACARLLACYFNGEAAARGFMVGARAEAAVPLPVYFIPALIKVKIPISAHLSVSVEAAVWFVSFSFFFYFLPAARFAPFCLQPNRVMLHLKVDYFNK